MAKTTKSKSARRKRKQRRPNIPNYTGPSDAPVAATPAKAKKRAKAAPVVTKKAEVDFATEYHYVVNDLRMMVIVSAAMIVLLLVLNFLAI